MNPRILYYTVVWLGTVVEGFDRHAPLKCADKEKNAAVTKCCKKPRPFYCVFKSIRDQKIDPACDCLPHDQKTGDRRQEKRCTFNDFYKSHETDNEQWSVPCTGFETECHRMDVVDQNKWKKIDGQNMSCAFPNGAGKITYPMRYETMKKSGLLRYETAHCNLRNKDNSPINDLDFYNIFFTCWLFDCEIRLRIPSFERYTRAKITTGTRWCYPPILYPGAKLKYCPLYDMSLDVYKEGSNQASWAQEDSSPNAPCILPPFCERYLGIDANYFMFPLIDGKPDNLYCEVICPVDHNMGVDEDERPCRRRPTCGEGDKYRVTDFFVPGCLPWCSPEDSYFRKVELRTKKECNNIPVCDRDGEPPTPFSEENPFGLKLANKVKCLKRRECAGNETKKTHFCSLDDVDKEASIKKGGRGGEMNIPVVASVAAGAFILLLILVLIMVIICVIIRRNKRRRMTISESMVERSNGQLPPSQRTVNVSDRSDWQNITQNKVDEQSAFSQKALGPAEPEADTQPETELKSRTASSNTRSRSNPQPKTNRKVKSKTKSRTDRKKKSAAKSTANRRKQSGTKSKNDRKKKSGTMTRNDRKKKSKTKSRASRKTNRRIKKSEATGSGTTNGTTVDPREKESRPLTSIDTKSGIGSASKEKKQLHDNSYSTQFSSAMEKDNSTQSYESSTKVGKSRKSKKRKRKEHNK